jgi:hypothetical protein
MSSRATYGDQQGRSADTSARSDEFRLEVREERLYVGPLEDLVAANAALQAWGEEPGVVWATTETGTGTVWASRTETYLTDPSEGPNAGTEIAYLTIPQRLAR